MATKTVVCPECGSEAAPGRFACAECGALLASVALTPRAVPSAESAAADAAAADAAAPRHAAPDESPVESPGLTDDWDAAVADSLAGGDATVAIAPDLPAEPSPAPEWPDPEVARQVVATAGTRTATGEPPDAAGPPATETSEDAAPFDENAPLAAAARAAHRAAVDRAVPDVLHRVDDPRLDEAPDDEPLDPADDVMAASRPEPGWPPAGTIGTIVLPEPRTPAGAYLPPSAVLPPLDAPGVPVAAAAPAAGRAGAAGAAGPMGTQGADEAATAIAGRSAADALGRGAAALGDAFGSARISGDAARRAVAAGAAIAALGLLLPWVNSLPGTSPFTGYLDRWGLAGPGLWLVFLALAGLAAVAASGGRAAGWPVGLPALVGAGFLVGLIWPYTIGGGGRSVGIWTVGVGIVVLIVGGILERRSRHDHGDASV